MLEVIDIFLRGGIVMWPIFALSVLGLALLIWVAFAMKRFTRAANRALVVVSTIITAEPLLGILGTIIGIMQTFSALNDATGSSNPLSATAGIGEALITTAAGIIASLILLFPYNVLDSKLGEIEDQKGESS